MTINAVPRCTVTSGSGSASSTTLVWPTDSTKPIEGDYLVITVAMDADSPSLSFNLTGAGGWQKLAAQELSVARDFSAAVFVRHKLDTAAEPDATVTFNVTSSFHAIALCFDGTDLERAGALDDLDDDPAYIGDVGTACATGSATNSTANALAIAIALCNTSNSLDHASSGWDGSWTERVISPASASRGGISVASQALTSTGSQSGVNTLATADCNWVLVLLLKETVTRDLVTVDITSASELVDEDRILSTRDGYAFAPLPHTYAAVEYSFFGTRDHIELMIDADSNWSLTTPMHNGSSEIRWRMADGTVGLFEEADFSAITAQVIDAWAERLFHAFGHAEDLIELLPDVTLADLEDSGSWLP